MICDYCGKEAGDFKRCPYCRALININGIENVDFEDKKIRENEKREKKIKYTFVNTKKSEGIGSNLEDIKKTVDRKFEYGYNGDIEKELGEILENNFCEDSENKRKVNYQEFRVDLKNGGNQNNTNILDEITINGKKLNESTKEKIRFALGLIEVGIIYFIFIK